MASPFLLASLKLWRVSLRWGGLGWAEQPIRTVLVNLPGECGA